MGKYGAGCMNKKNRTAALGKLPRECHHEREFRESLMLIQCW
jgi:hypothetical protein